MNLSIAKDISVIAASLIGLITLVKAVVEYTRQNTQHRADHYQKLRDQFRDDPQFRELFILLETNDKSLECLPFQQKQHLIGFYEDIALSVNSGLIKKEVAHYMFGYYALRCWESDYFWGTVNRNSPYWSLFKHFVKQMDASEIILLQHTNKTSNYKL